MRIKTNRKRLQGTAYHEAGHAVARWEKRLPFKHATIVPQKAEGNLGHVLFAKPPNGSTSSPGNQIALGDNRRNLIIVDFAGSAGEELFEGHRHADYLSAVNFAIHVFGPQDTVRALLHLCFLEARDLVDVLSWAVEGVAEPLIERKTLTAAEVNQPILDASAPHRSSCYERSQTPRASRSYTTAKAYTHALSDTDQDVAAA